MCTNCIQGDAVLSLWKPLGLDREGMAGPSLGGVTPALTTVRVPLSEAGYQAFRATVDEEWEQPELPLEVIERASTPRIRE